MIRVGGGSSCAIWTLVVVGTTQSAVAGDPTARSGDEPCTGRIPAIDQDFLEGRTHTKIAAGAWIHRISDLAVGNHRLAIRQRVYGSSAEAVFHIEVDDVPCPIGREPVPATSAKNPLSHSGVCD